MGLPRDAASASVHDHSASHRRATRIRWLAAAVLVVVLAGAAGYAGQQRLHQHQKEVAAAQALDAARKYAIKLSNIDSNAIDQTLADILDGSTGEFKVLYTKSASQLRQLLVDNQAVTRGHVVESAVKSAEPNKVQVLLFVDQSVTNVASPKPKIDRSRLRMTMEKVDGRWLVSRIELP